MSDVNWQTVFPKIYNMIIIIIILTTDALNISLQINCKKYIHFNQNSFFVRLFLYAIEECTLCMLHIHSINNHFT